MNVDESNDIDDVLTRHANDALVDPLNALREILARVRRAARGAAWIALAAIIAIAFHYGEKYESDMLTDHFQTTVTLPDTPRPAPTIVN